MEYVDATYGKRQITWSRGGKSLLGVDDKSDEELASDHPGSDDDTEDKTEESPVVLMSISSQVWSLVLRCSSPGRLIEVARQGGQDAVRSYLDWLVSSMKIRGHPS